MAVGAPTFSLDDLLHELLRGEEPPPGYHTVGEWAAILHISRNRADELLTLAHSQGKLSHCYRDGEDRAGRRCRLPAYKFEVT